MEEGVDEGPVAVADGGVDDEARGLVEDEEVLVLEQDGERDLLRDELRLRRRGRREDDVDLVARRDLRGSLRRGAPVDGDEPRVDPLLDLRPRGLGEVRQVAEEDAVEALAGVAAVGAEGPAGEPRGVAPPAPARAGRPAAASARIPTPSEDAQSAMNCDVEITPKTVPRGSPRKNSTVPRRSASRAR